jgi:hypothetical protein
MDISSATDTDAPKYIRQLKSLYTSLLNAYEHVRWMLVIDLAVMIQMKVFAYHLCKRLCSFMQSWINTSTVQSGRACTDQLFINMTSDLCITATVPIPTRNTTFNIILEAIYLTSVKLNSQRSSTVIPCHPCKGWSRGEGYWSNCRKMLCEQDRVDLATSCLQDS